MISADMKTYNYFTFGQNNAYGQPQLSAEPTGAIKIAIYTINTNTTDSILYKEATYIGLTQAEVNNTYVIDNGTEKLKVLYVNPKGRYKQVYMVTYG